MKNKAGILIFLTSVLTVSCYKPYTTDIDNDEKVLVVDGLITNKVASYHIKLKYSSKFYSSAKAKPVSNARVTVTDDFGTVINFRETLNGDYVSDSTKFTAVPGKSYTLRIETQEGDIYESSVQKMENEFTPDSVYAIIDYIEYISRFNQILKTIHGAKIYANISSKSGLLPSFRFYSELSIQYFYDLRIYTEYPPPLYSFYCWQLERIEQGVNLVDKYFVSQNFEISNQELYFIDNNSVIDGRIYDLGPQLPDLSYLAIPTTERKIYNITNRLLYVELYSLNDDSFSYYQKINKQLTSEGKIYDPISVQIRGNVKCISKIGKNVFGLFEVSSLSKTAYTIGLRNPITNQVPVKEIPSIIPPLPDGCMINKVPVFWIN